VTNGCCSSRVPRDCGWTEPANVTWCPATIS
jgi:hypothetical protein